MTIEQIEQMRINSCRKGLTMYGEYVAGATDASEWQRKHDIHKACEWLIKNAINYADMSPLNSWSVGVLVYDFRKAMEEE